MSSSLLKPLLTLSHTLDGRKNTLSGRLLIRFRLLCIVSSHISSHKILPTHQDLVLRSLPCLSKLPACGSTRILPNFTAGDSVIASHTITHVWIACSTPSHLILLLLKLLKSIYRQFFIFLWLYLLCLLLYWILTFMAKVSPFWGGCRWLVYHNRKQTTLARNVFPLAPISYIAVVAKKYLKNRKKWWIQQWRNRLRILTRTAME